MNAISCTRWRFLLCLYPKRYSTFTGSIAGDIAYQNNTWNRVLVHHLFVRGIIPFLVLLITLQNVTIAGDGFRNITRLTSNPVTYAPLEFTFDLDKAYDNPYDNSEVDVTGVLTLPDGSVIRYPAFYFQEFKRSLFSGKQTLEQVGTPKWCLRYSPPIPGTYRLHLELTGATRKVTSDEFQIYVSPSAYKGPLRAAPTGSLSPFRFQDGTPFYPVGHNIAWAGPTDTYAYDAWFGRLEKVGGNFTRVWMTQIQGSTQSLEWNKDHASGYFHGVGRYSQEGAWNLDYIIRLAWEKGIHLQLVLQHHGQFSTSVDPIWSDNPYNVSNGGFLSSPDQFFVDEKARDLFKRKVRYVVARCGAYPNIIWELFNEVNATTNFNETAIAAWHEEMASYIRKVDYLKHLITTSTDIWHSRIWNVHDIDIVQLHLYTGERPDDIYHAVEYSRRYGKPVVIGEYSLGPNLKQALIDSAGIAVKATIWASFLSCSAGMSWWWDNYIDPFELYRHYKGLTAFLAAERETGDSFGRAGIKVVGGRTSRDGLTVFPNKYLYRPLQTQFVLQEDGTVESLDQLSANLRPAHELGYSRLTFHLTFQREIELAVDIAEVRDGLTGIMTLELDEGRSGNFQATVQAGSQIVIPVPGHVCSITVMNAGTSVLRVGSYRFKGVAVSAVGGTGVMSERKAYVWLRDRSWWFNEGSNGIVENATLRLTGMIPGRYRVEFWDTFRGEKIGVDYVSSSWEETELAVRLPSFENSLAAKVVWDGVASAATEASSVPLRAYDPYPNPSNSSVKTPSFSRGRPPWRYVCTISWEDWLPPSSADPRIRVLTSYHSTRAG